MIDLAPVILLAVLLLGVLLVWLGAHGRRVNDHPQCRMCGFDLHGVYPASTTCPECGADLHMRRAVRAGVRQKRMGLVVLGGSVLGVGGLVILAAVWLMFAGPRLNKYKPALVLMLEGRHMGATHSRDAAKELVGRLNAGTLGEGTTNRAVNTALAIQADLSLAWAPEWGDLIEAARTRSLVDDETYTRFLRQSVVLDVRVRPEIGDGKPVPLLVSVSEWRCAGAPGQDLCVWLEKVRFGTHQLKWARYGTTIVTLQSSAYGMVIGSTQSPGWTGKRPTFADTLPLELITPVGKGAGFREVELEVRIGALGKSSLPMGQSKGSWNVVDRLALRRTTSVIAGTETASAAEPDARTREQLQEFLNRTKVQFLLPIRAPEDPSTCLAHVSVPRMDPPIPFAFDVVIRIGNQEFPAGEVTTGQLPRGGKIGLVRGGTVTDAERECLVVATIPVDEATGGTPAGGEVIFRPSAALAQSTLDLTSFYPAEMTVRFTTKELAKSP